MELDPLPTVKIELLPDGRRGRLLEPIALLSRCHVINVPRGFVTDFASVPRLFWRIIPPWGEYALASVVHDYLCTQGRFPRKEADLIFLDLMKRLGVPLWKRQAMYRAVRLYSIATFKK